MAETDIAIVGMAAHVPGGRNPDEFWRSLCAGEEQVRELDEEELVAAGVPRDVVRRPGYVRATVPLEGVFDFDAEFFGLSPKEAGVMDPQHRHFLMAVWEALEDAGHVPSSFDGAIGLFAGVGQNSYFVQNVLSNRDLVDDVGHFLLRHTGNDKDFLTTRASYVLDLHGPSVNVQTACSTSLVATHLAVQHLLSGECDIALAGGVTIEIPHGQGYQYQEGEVLSPDGHCRAFDHRSKGTIFGSGVGIVALRRLDDAIADGDRVYAVIKGTAVNNDGSRKVGYLAPSIDGQAACVTEALAVADVDPATLGYIECHGTGTPMGDPIEVAALSQAFRASTDATGFCRIGSVKTNIGHLDTAAGVVGLIKAALAVHHGVIPPSLNFEAPNPALQLETSPFVVNDELHTWTTPDGAPRRAGVNSLGVGGTNAFVVLEEPPPPAPASTTTRPRLLTITGRSRATLDANTQRLAEHLRAHPDADLGDVAWTLQTGRQHFDERRVLVARDAEDAAALLEEMPAHRVFTHTAGHAERRLAFMFPGGGVQHVGMGADLYAQEPEFARHVDLGLRLLADRHGVDLRPVLFASADTASEAADALEDPLHQLPAIFIVQHAMARLLISRGLEPTSLVGYSLGENTAACIAGTMSFEDCLSLVALRGRLMSGTGDGGALAVPLAEGDVAGVAEAHGLDVAILNGPELTVVSGPAENLSGAAAALREMGADPIAIPLKAAAHSRLLDPILDEFRAHLRTLDLRPPTIPWVSNRTGTWITDAQATDPDYWVEHLRHTVRFSDCIETLAEDPGLTLLEIGPRRSLSSIVRAHPALKAGQASIPVMRHPDEAVSDDIHLETAIGRLWAVGGPLDVERAFDGEERRRAALPTYAFRTQPFKIEPGQRHAAPDEGSSTFVDREDEDRWQWTEVWRSADVDEPVDEPLTWLVIVDGRGVDEEIVDRLAARGDQVVVARCGDSYLAVSDTEYVIAPELGSITYENLVRDLMRSGHIPDRIAHLALLNTDESGVRPGSSWFHRNQELGFQSLVLLAQAWAGSGLSHPLHLVVATMGAQRARRADRPRWPEQATVIGPASVIPREFADVTVATVDVDPDELRDGASLRARVRAARRAVASRIEDDAASEPSARDLLVDSLEAELLAPATNRHVALRGERRFVRDVRRARRADGRARQLRDRASVLITGGLGGIGLTIAETLVDRHDARVALMSRSPMPPHDEWDELLGRLGPDHPTSVRIRRIRALEARGASILLVHGDVTDVTDVGRVVGEVRERFGAIDAVVHAAGVVADALLVTKAQTDMDDVLAPKVYGTLVLDEATRDDDLDLFVVFSSTSVHSAPVGQTDYVAANAFLNAWASARRAAGAHHVLALGWGVWNEVGMAAAAAAADDAEPDAAELTGAVHPFFSTVERDRRGLVRLTSRWTTADEWFLDDHRTAAGDALLPGTGYVELARGALQEIGLTRPFELRGLTFLRPLAVPDGEEVVVETALRPTDEGYEMVVRERVSISDSTAESEPVTDRVGWRRTAEATILLRPRPDVPTVDLAAVEASCPTRLATRTAQQDFLRFGPRWDVVRRAQRGATDAVAWLELPPEHAGDVDEVGVHPGLLDLATGFAMELVEGYSGSSLWVPVDYQRIQFVDRLPSSVVSIARARSSSSEASGFATFDVTICAPDGTVLLIVSGFTIKRLEATLDLGRNTRVLATDVEVDGHAARAASRSELVFRNNLSQGIRPAEGGPAFLRAIASDADVVYVSSMDVHALRRQSTLAAAEQLGTGADSTAVFGRPELDADYLEPRNDTEAALVTIWQDLLGIDRIGVDDNFFDLGGHSLIAVRLFAKVKRMFGVEFPISVLFEAPTIAACAALIADAMPSADTEVAPLDGTPDGDAEPAATSTIPAPQPRFRHLVAMHPGEAGPRTPFFLVAGMFGNVLNLRHLAHLIGTDRPFYGVQARGIYGDEPPHDDFLEMARAYVEEVQQMQPRGPYLLGGFSGGGITALEMARILKDKGEEVDLLVMLDTPAPTTDRELTLGEKVSLHLGQLQKNGASYVGRWATSRLRWERERRLRRHQPDAPVEEGSLHSTVVVDAFYRALERYEMRPYDGDIRMYRPKLTPLHVFGSDRQIDINRRFIYHDNGWSDWCAAVDVTEVPGNHDSMVLEPNVRVLAANIRADIERVDQRAATPPGLPG